MSQISESRTKLVWILPSVRDFARRAMSQISDSWSFRGVGRKQSERSIDLVAGNTFRLNKEHLQWRNKWIPSSTYSNSIMNHHSSYKCVAPGLVTAFGTFVIPFMDWKQMALEELAYNKN